VHIHLGRSVSGQKDCSCMLMLIFLPMPICGYHLALGQQIHPKTSSSGPTASKDKSTSNHPSFTMHQNMYDKTLPSMALIPRS
jgi:hypothetical protein